MARWTTGSRNRLFLSLNDTENRIIRKDILPLVRLQNMKWRGTRRSLRRGIYSQLSLAMQFSRDKKRELLVKAFWDKNVDIEYILNLLEGGAESVPGDRIDLYHRLLATYDWYTVLKLIPIDRLKNEALSEAVINRLFPDELRKKYRYAQRILSEKAISLSG